MEEPIARLIADIDARFYVIACLQNMNPDQVRERALPLVEIIREKRPRTPVLFVPNIMYSSAFLNNNLEGSLKRENEILKNEYQKMHDKGFKNIYYMDTRDALGTDHEGTVDGIHLTDLGFIRYADHYIRYFKEIGLDLIN
jgi:hypothetical protein